MKKYIDTVTDQFGNALKNVQVLVLTYPNNTIATLHADDGVTTISNPVVTDSTGQYSFTVVDGYYNLQYTYPTGSTKTVTAVQIASATSTATSIVLTPVNGITATNVQDAIARLSSGTNYPPEVVSAWEGVPWAVFGDSWGQGSTNYSDPGTKFFDRVNSRCRGLSFSNFAVPGARMDQIVSAIKTSWVPNSRGVVGLADCLINDSGSGSSANQLTVAEGMLSALSYLTSRAVVNYDQPSFQYGPGWTAGVSSTTGSYVDLGFNGTSVVLLAEFVTTSGGVLTITQNGTGSTLATMTTGNYTRAFTGAMLLTGFSSGSNTVRITLTSGTAQVTGLSSPSAAPPTIVWLKATVGSGSSAFANLPTLQAAVQPIVSSYPTTISVAADGNYNVGSMMGPDQTHPNDLGNSYYAARIIRTANANAVTWRQGQNQLTRSGTADAAYTPSTPAYQVAGATAPAAPTNFTATTDRQVALSWTAAVDNRATLTAYQIRYSPAGAGTWTVITPNYSALTLATVITTGLTQGNSYDFQIAAINPIGQSAWSATATATAGQAVTVYALDDFNRADGNIGNVPSGTLAGTAYSSIAGVQFLISGNRAACPSTSANASQVEALLDTGAADGLIQATNYNLVEQGLSFRVNAGQTAGYMFARNDANGYSLFKRTTATAFSRLVATSGVTAASGDVLRVILNGSAIKCYINGTLVIYTTDSSNTGTKHGLWCNASVSAQWDNFSLTNQTT